MGKNPLDRRTFLKRSLLSGAGAVIAPSVFAQSNNSFEKPGDEKGRIIKRKLGKTGIELPVVSFGVMRADSPALVQAALKEGIILFDTAHGYQRGKNEEMLGEVFKDYPRESFVLATKVEPEGIDRQTGLPGPNVTAKAFLDKFDISLKRLKMDYVDILYAHSLMTREAVLHPEIIEALTTAKKTGKAKHIGLSVHRNEPGVIRTAIECGIYEVILTSYNFKQDHYKEVKKAVAEAAEAGIGIVAMKTMAGGFHDKARTEPINCKAALKFVLQDENVTTSIPGNTNFDQLTMNASINYDITLTSEEKLDLAKGPAQGSLYCQGCQICVPDCKKSLPIPDLMRAYMYTYGYRDNEQAYALLKSLNLPDDPCKECGECSAQCAKNFVVSERIADVMRLKSVPEEFIS
jgi:predicted aldo/keto reductase-like oxidoreductase